MGINTTVDLDLTDLFFNLYKQKDYFNIEKYSPERYKEYLKRKANMRGQNIEYIEKIFQRMYGSPVYNFYSENEISKKR